MNNTSASHISAGQASDQINQSFREREVQDQAKKLGLPYINVSELPINPDVFDYIPYDIAQKLGIIPFRQLGDTLSIAFSSTSAADYELFLKNLAEERYLTINRYLSTADSINLALTRFTHLTPLVSEASAPGSDELILNYKDAVASLHALGEQVNKLGDSLEALQIIERGALAVNASDIHFEPRAKEAQVKFRIDGVLHFITNLRPKIYDFFTTQIKHKAGMKINVTTIPQDGRYTITASQQKVDVRVSSLPTEYGDSLVLRVLYQPETIRSLKNLGYIDPSLTMLNQTKELSQGMILVTGPTGSGKSTTLYTLLAQFNTGDRKIITLEDPVEYHINGIVQSPIKEEDGYTFAKGLEAILRQDPDVIMIGEIRDKNTATTATQAAITGHVVLCTLHTNSGIEAIPRLLNMGVPNYILASALKVIVGQRLVRTLCSCKQPAVLSPSDAAWLQKQILNYAPDLANIQQTIVQATGCSNCAHTGYSGRIVVAESFETDQQFADLVLEGASIKALRTDLQTRNLLYSIQKDALIKVLTGQTTLEEVKRVVTF